MADNRQMAPMEIENDLEISARKLSTPANERLKNLSFGTKSPHLMPKSVNDRLINIRNEPYCICKRSHILIHCSVCKEVFRGRVDEMCPVHPNVSFLMDAYSCVKCGASKDNLVKNYKGEKSA